MSNWKKIEISTPNGKFLEKTEKSEFSTYLYILNFMSYIAEPNIKSGKWTY